MTGIIAHPTIVRDIIMGTCLCILIFAVLFASPLLGVFTLLLLPLPVLYFRLKLGRNSGAVIVGASFAAMMLLSRGTAPDMLYIGSLLITGLFLGECIERHMRIEKTMIYTGAGVIGAGVAAFFLYAALKGVTAGDIVSDYVDQYFRLTADLYSDMGIGQEQVDTLNTAILTVMPGMFIVSYMSTVWLNILLIKRLLQRIGIRLKSIEHLNYYKSPHKLVWAVIASGALMLVPMQAGKYFGINCFIVLMLVYFFQGIAIVSFFFEKKNIPPLLKIFCYGMIALQLYFLILVIGLGFFDTWINFRKLHSTNGHQSNHRPE